MIFIAEVAQIMCKQHKVLKLRSGRLRSAQFNSKLYVAIPSAALSDARR